MAGQVWRFGSTTSLVGSTTPLVGALALALLLLAAAAPAARAQEPPPPPERSLSRERGREAPPDADGPRRGRRGARGELLRSLGLTPEQRQRLREIRRQSEPEVRALNRRVGLARRALNEAVYAETLDERMVEERAGELAAAQAALVRLRALNEVRVRQVLTPEQLRTFRELRRQAVVEMQGHRTHDDSAPPERREGFGHPRRRGRP
ncbi:MAG TPA: Spy/CpxP family protein refolding chaperone [Pyrinomonadaceae bacterium]|nr:Spy/CpxP family protein refolding chaperone [Pyrinomonadaceae bacterium]